MKPSRVQLWIIDGQERGEWMLNQQSSVPPSFNPSTQQLKL